MIQPKWDQLAESTQSRVMNGSSNKQQLHDAYIAGYNRALREARRAAPAPAWLQDVRPPIQPYPNNQLQQDPALLYLPKEPIEAPGVVPGRGMPSNTYTPDELLMLPKGPTEYDGGAIPGDGTGYSDLDLYYDDSQDLRIPYRDDDDGVDPYSWQAGGA